MSQIVVVYDACVMYPAPLRSLLMYLALTDLYRAKWTHHIHEEWMRNVQKDYPDITRNQTERIRDLMNAHVRDCLVTHYEPLIESLSLPDPNDRHVLAAAIRAGAALIVTFNLKDFPQAALVPYGVEARHPDDFLIDQLSLASDIVCSAVRQHRASLKNPPKDVSQYLESLEAQGLPQTVAELRKLSEHI
ncbi:MAG: PIN domain-containing protein [Pirellulales bacterium]